MFLVGLWGLQSLSIWVETPCMSKIEILLVLLSFYPKAKTTISYAFKILQYHKQRRYSKNDKIIQKFWLNVEAFIIEQNLRISKKRFKHHTYLTLIYSVLLLPLFIIQTPYLSVLYFSKSLFQKIDFPTWFLFLFFVYFKLDFHCLNKIKKSSSK